MPPPTLPAAILRTVAYADVFDQPVRFDELHRYLYGTAIRAEDLRRALENGAFPSEALSLHEGWLTLKGREALREVRAARAPYSSALWPVAIQWGQRLARLPFVRMVAVTGALAVDNAVPGADLDYFIIAEPGRVWTCRLFAVALVRLAARRGVALCPNYVLAADALALADHSLFTARELAQMVPLSGLAVYAQMRRANPWVDELLPNAGGHPGLRQPFDLAQGKAQPDGVTPPLEPRLPLGSRAIEWVLRASLGDRLEQWEMDRKIKKFSRGPSLTDETRFTADRVQGHFEGYRARTLAAVEEKLRALGVGG